MFVAIFLIAVLLLAVGAVSAWQAFLLIPTDLGLAYMQGAYTAGCAGLAVLALGLAARKIAAAGAVSALAHIRAETVARPARQEPMAEAPGREPAAALAGAGAAVGMAAGAALATVRTEAETPASPAASRAASDVRLLDDLEKDLFADLPALPRLPEAGPVASPVEPVQLPARSILAEAGDNAASQTAALVQATPSPTDAVAGEATALAAAEHASPVMSDDAIEQELQAALQLDDPAFARRVRAAEEHFAQTLPLPASPTETEASPPGAIDEPGEPPQQGMSGPAPEAKALQEDGAGGPPTMADIAPEVPTGPAGLIHDADLAALESELPPLVPIEQLEEVGSYESAGTRFTMYSDGSVNTLGPEGERRFRTLDELRAHLDKRGR